MKIEQQQHGMEEVRSWHSCLTSTSLPQNHGETRADGGTALERWLLSNQRHPISPYAFHLAKLDWAVFGALTFNSDFLRGESVGAQRKRVDLFSRLLGKTCERNHLRRRNLAIYRKTEYGSAMQAHFHFLIAAKGLGACSPEQFAQTAQELWTKPGPFRNSVGGWHGRWEAKIEPFDASRHWEGIAYQAKIERDARGNRLELDEYLSGKLKGLIHKANAEQSNQFGFSC